MCNRPLICALSAVTVTASPASAEPPSACRDLPANIVARDGYGEIVVDALHRSPTLTRQCQSIAATPETLVVIRLPHGPVRTARARGTICRGPRGLFAVIEIPVTGDFAELLAHEFEHVLEQIEGEDLRRRARARDPAVHASGPGVFETDRAHRAGLTVRREVMTRVPRTMADAASTTPLTRTHASGVQVAGGVPTPSAPNQSVRAAR